MLRVTLSKSELPPISNHDLLESPAWCSLAGERGRGVRGIGLGHPVPIQSRRRRQDLVYPVLIQSLAVLDGYWMGTGWVLDGYWMGF